MIFLIMADLFSSSTNLQKITVADVESFLGLNGPEEQRPQEGSRLDYKSSEPERIGDDVAALSNSDGGIIFIGVKSKKKKHNVPVNINGHPVKSGDVKSRLTGKILATVRPRPSFEIAVVPLDEDRCLTILRVGVGLHPPYEFQQGDILRIPIRFQDTNRQATLFEIEALLQRRSPLIKVADKQLIDRYVNHNLTPIRRTDQGSMASGCFQRFCCIPRVPTKFRLDRANEDQFKSFIQSAFEDSSLGQFREISRDYESITLDWQSVITGETLQTRLRRFKMWADGTVAFAENLDWHQPAGSRSLGSILLSASCFVRLAKAILAKMEYFLPVTFAIQLRAMEPITLDATVSVDRQPRNIDWLNTPLARQSRAQGELLTWEEMDWDSLGAEQLADAYLMILRHVTQATVEFSPMEELFRLMLLSPEAYLS